MTLGVYLFASNVRKESNAALSLQPEIKHTINRTIPKTVTHFLGHTNANRKKERNIYQFYQM